MNTRFLPLLLLIATVCTAPAADATLRLRAIAGMKKAAEFFRERVATHGGYVYYYSLDSKERWGEGEATEAQIFVQPPGTPAVGMAMLRAFEATGDKFHLDAARKAAEALVFGQLESGGWSQRVDFKPGGEHAGQYRNGKSRGRNVSSLDDDTTQAALRFLMHTDRALAFKHEGIREASEYARRALLAAQHPRGGFPQGWSGPAPKYNAVRASFPDYDWRTENRIKAYWDLPTLNDNLCGAVALTLEEAAEIYADKDCRAALLRLGDFLILAQMPEPQPGWAQQYDREMRPVWARKFEPPALAGRESKDAIKTLLRVYRVSRDEKYLRPVPAALAWLRRAVLPDGQLARYYELRTNKPLYMTEKYELTHDDSHAPKHYGWKGDAKLESLERDFEKAKTGGLRLHREPKADEARVLEILADLDGEGRWVSTFQSGSLTGAPKFKKGFKFISSEVFAENLTVLADYLLATEK